MPGHFLRFQGGDGDFSDMESFFVVVVVNYFCIAKQGVLYYMEAMQTLVLRIPDDLARELETEAQRKRLTKSEVARRRLIDAGRVADEELAGFEMVADFVGSVKGGPTDMSAKKKHYLKTMGYGKKRDR